jgi:arylformamidase
MPLIDITRPLHSGMPHWPGDVPTTFQVNMRIADGHACNVGQLKQSVHNGTHADAPWHYDDQGARIDAVDLSHYVGPCRVIDARNRGTLTPDLLDGLSPGGIPRLLFRTDAWSDPATFPTTWPLLSGEMPARLAALGIRLIGLDVPSVDALTSRDLAMHHALGNAGILILENLDLRSAEPGDYELIALPLKVRDSDAAPVRAVLRTPA